MFLLCAIVIFSAAIVVELSDCIIESVCRHVLFTAVTVRAIKLDYSYQLHTERTQTDQSHGSLVKHLVVMYPYRAAGNIHR